MKNLYVITSMRQLTCNTYSRRKGESAAKVTIDNIAHVLLIELVTSVEGNALKGKMGYLV